MNKTETKICDAYWNYLQENEKPPVSLRAFLKSLKMTEKEFYQHFASLDEVESQIWSRLVQEIIDSIKKGKEFSTFTAEQRLLTFGFAFLEKSLEVRSVMQSQFKKIGPFHGGSAFDSFAPIFKKFAQEIIDQGKKTGEIADRGKLMPLYKEGLYLLFRGLIDFNLQDRSKGFERSDAYWEKSVRLVFDLMKSQAIDSAFDLAKFLIPQKKN